MNPTSRLKKSPLATLLLLCLNLIPTLAFAHSPSGESVSFQQGWLHPFSGIDHLLAMIAVGVWSAQIGGRALWLMPLAFVGMMLSGFFIGITWLALPFSESGIIVSVLVMGLLITLAARPPLLFSGLLVTLFALCHGYAHGVELPAGAENLPYLLGALLATATLHLLGSAVSAFAQRLQRAGLIRFMGALITLFGGYLWLNA